MAQQITFWQMSGKSDLEITVRLKNLAELAEVMSHMPSGTDVVTLNRTDKQSNITHEVWHSKQYVDLNERD